MYLLVIAVLFFFLSNSVFYYEPILTSPDETLDIVCYQCEF